MRPNRGGRTPSGPWGRLKPVEQDPLDSIGLPSKGDTRLLDSKTQESYYTKIVKRYMTFCSDAGERDELLRRFASLDLKSKTAPTPSSSSQPPSSKSTPTPNINVNATDPTTAPPDPTSGSSSSPPPIIPSSDATTWPLSNSANTKALADVMMALRKLREGIVASKRADDFAIQAYLFNIRLSVLTAHPESYHPAILHLLRRIHPLRPLTTLELHEVVAYLILDTACRRADLAEAYALRHRWRLRDAKVDAALRALAHDDYVAFRRVARSIDGHRARLLGLADKEMRTHALKCFGRSYLVVDRGFLERCAGAGWETLRERDGVGWELDGDTVVIQKVKGR